MTSQEEIAKILLNNKAVTLSANPPYTWASGIKAPIYCDNRLLISFPEERKKIINGFKELISKHKLEFDVIGGTAMAAVPWAAFLAYEIGKPMVYIRPEPKDHGKGKQVEGFMQKGARILIVEDLISTGGSSLKSATACQREYDAQIIGVIAIFSYEMEKAKLTFTGTSLTFYTLSNFSSLIDVATQLDYLKPEDKENVLKWNADPENWWASTSK